MSSVVKVLGIDKQVSGESDSGVIVQKKYVLSYDAATNPTVSNVVERFRTKGPFSDPNLRLVSVTTEDEDFGTVDVEESDPLMQLHKYSAAFRSESGIPDVQQVRSIKIRQSIF